MESEKHARAEHLRKGGRAVTGRRIPGDASSAAGIDLASCVLGYVGNTRRLNVYFVWLSLWGTRRREGDGLHRHDLHGDVQEVVLKKGNDQCRAHRYSLGNHHVPLRALPAGLAQVSRGRKLTLHRAEFCTERRR